MADATPRRWELRADTCSRVGECVAPAHAVKSPYTVARFGALATRPSRTGHTTHEGHTMGVKAELETAQPIALKERAAATGEDRQRAELRLLAIRGALGALGEAEMGGKTRRDLDDAEQLAVVKKEVTKREQSAGIYDEAGEPERAAAERAEAEVLRAFLPAETSEADIRAAIEGIIAERGLAGQGGRAIGVVMAELKAQFENFDSRAASALVKELVA